MCLGIILYLWLFFAFFPAISSISAVKYSNTAAVYTGAVNPTLLCSNLALFFRCLLILPTGKYNPAFSDLLILN